MNSLQVKVRTKIDYSLIMSPAEFWDFFMLGIPRCYANGSYISDESIIQKILAAQSFLENFLQIKLTKQISCENKEYIRGDHMHWGYVFTNYLVIKAFSYQGFYNDLQQINFPKEWLSVKKDTNVANLYRSIQIIPNYGQALAQNVFLGLTQAAGFMAIRTIPNYWLVTYCTGFDETPNDLFNFVGKLVSIQFLDIVGELLIGFGVNSTSISLDGLSQSVSKQHPVFGERLRNLTQDIKDSLPILKDIYKGILFESM